MGLTAADTNKNISERGIILDPILQPTMVPSAVIDKSFKSIQYNAKKKLNSSVAIIWFNLCIK